ncbi:DNA polymerase I [Paenisporosarcina cavernae]|uniref:DNA polymerase I n=1 Tax=Paenisporosarcina cavernae TaxID=2320858 RepID=A0A385YSK4_9BACL|nr:DNA polymerase I [Paenisporosarcina cavernae]AYC29825.1 DNA polymerase I [Paenisporosarcina cavernae]
MTKNKLVLLDGNSLAYRAFFALPLLTNDKGIHTNAVYGFTLMLQKILEDEKPTHLLVAFDAGKTTFRHETFQEYKGGRQKTPPELSEQFPYIRKLLKAYGIREYELPNYEADDIIGTFSKQSEQQGDTVIIVSGDKDLTQLASNTTSVYITKKGLTDLEVYTPEHVKEKYGLTPQQIIDMKGLMGDSSDNIPGVPGVGEKTAIKLLVEYQSVENVLENIDSISGAKLKERLTENKEQAIMSKQLATIETNAPIEINMEDLQYSGANEDDVIDIWKELSFNSLLEKSEYVQESQPIEEISYEIVSSLTKDLLEKEMAIHIEMYDEHYHSAEILGFGLTGERQSYFITPDILSSSPDLKEWLESSDTKKLAVDSKATIAALHRLGIDVKGITFDFILASYIANPGISSADLQSLAQEFQYRNINSEDQVYGKGAKKAIPSQTDLADHVIRKTYMVWQLKDAIQAKLRENNQYELYAELELPLALILGDMEAEGIKVDRKTLVDLGEELTRRISEVEEKINTLAGEKVNSNSPKQLGVLLFEKLGLPVLKKTKTGYSTAADVLEKLEGQHEIIAPILLYRQLVKLNSTYIEGLLKEIGTDEKIHTRYQQALTQTGRLSSIQPNLQNIPIRLEEGRKIRKAFIPSQKDWVLFAADYSQIELRVLAHMSGDASLIEAFQQDMDVHTKTAMDVFHVSQEDVTSEMRRAAKAVNFGIVYGISDYGLSQNLSITRKEAAEFIERYLETFPGVKQYMHDIVQDAKQKGYVQTIMNRRRYLPDITSSNFNLRNFAERTAMNTPIQGSAADIIKKAMIDMDHRLKAENLQAKMLLQVHDELILEAPKEELELLQKLVPEVMEHAVKLNVPLKVDAAFGNTWYETK